MPALLSRERVRDRDRCARRAPSADQRGELRALQVVRHQGSVRDHQLDDARGRLRTQLSSVVTMTEALWRPSAERVANANLTRFMAGVNSRHGTSLEDFAALYDWSIREAGHFWRELARFADIRARWGSDPVIADPQRMPGARFFGDTRLSFAENLLRHRDAQPAIIFRNERGA